MKKIIKLTESELSKVIKKIITEVTIPKTTDEIKDFQSWVVNVKKNKTILGKGGDDGKWGPKTQLAWNTYSNEYNKNVKKTSKKKPLVTPSTSVLQIAKIWFNKLTKGKNPSKNSSLLFDGSKLIWLSNGSEIESWGATSGVNLLNAEPSQWLDLAKNIFSSKQEKSKLKGFGPIPEGKYTVGKLQTSKLERTNPFMDFVRLIFKTNQTNHDWNKDTASTRISWGYYRAPIISNSGTKTYGRSDFYIHGGALPASHGCIDLTSSMDDFAKFYSSWASKYKKNSIQLTVKYSSSLINILA
jgi:hypothetical protein